MCPVRQSCHGVKGASTSGDDCQRKLQGSQQAFLLGCGHTATAPSDHSLEGNWMCSGPSWKITVEAVSIGQMSPSSLVPNLCGDICQFPHPFHSSMASGAHPACTSMPSLPDQMPTSLLCPVRSDRFGGSEKEPIPAGITALGQKIGMVFGEPQRGRCCRRARDALESSREAESCPVV